MEIEIILFLLNYLCNHDQSSAIIKLDLTE